MIGLLLVLAAFGLSIAFTLVLSALTAIQPGKVNLIRPFHVSGDTRP